MTCIGVFPIALLGSLPMTSLTVRIAHAFRLGNRPGLQKDHKTPMPRAGGIAIALSFFLTTLPFLQQNYDVNGEFHTMRLKQSLFLITRALIFVLGFFDNAYRRQAGTEFRMSIAAAIAVAFAAVRVTRFSVCNCGVVDLRWLSNPLPVAWIVGINNAISLLQERLAVGITATSFPLLTFFAARR